MGAPGKVSARFLFELFYGVGPEILEYSYIFIRNTRIREEIGSEVILKIVFQLLVSQHRRSIANGKLVILNSNSLC